MCKLTTFAIVSLMACGPTSLPAPTTSAVHIDTLAESTLPLSAVVGQDAALTLFLRAEHWSETKEILESFVGQTDNIPADLETLVSGIRPEWRHVIAALDGLDPSRPVVVRWGEASDDLAVAIAAAEGRVPNALREVVALPAMDASRVLSSVREGIAVLCPARGEDFVCSDDSVVHIEERPGWVFLLMGDEGALALTDVAPRSLTAVERWVTQTTSGFAFLLRPRRLRGAATFTHVRRLRSRRRRREGSNDVRALARVFLRYSVHGENFHELAIGFDPLASGMVSVGQLTEAGLARFSAAPTQRPNTPMGANINPPGAPVSNSPITIRAGRDLSALVARPPFAVQTRSNRSSRVRAFHDLQRFSDPLTFGQEYMSTGRHRAMTFEHQPELGADRVDAVVDPRHNGSTRGPTAFPIRSRVDGAGWSAVISRNENAGIPTFRAGPATPSPSDEAVDCLERYALMAIERPSNPGPNLDEEAAACARAGGLGAEIDTFQRVWAWGRPSTN